MSDRVLLWSAAGEPVKRILDGEDAYRGLLVEVFGLLAGHPRAKQPSFLLAEIEHAVGVPAIEKRFPDMKDHIGRAAQRHKATQAAKGKRDES